VFQDESGLSQRPAVRRTWAPRGQTPVLVHGFNWKKASLCAALGYRWDGRRARRWFACRAGSYDTAALCQFVARLRRERRGRPVCLVWDRLPAHRSAAMQAYLRRQRGWLRVFSLPASAPELNPLEGLWSALKGRDLANLCAENLPAATTACRRGVARVRRRPGLLRGFLRHTGLAL
jgi:transposase